MHSFLLIPIFLLVSRTLEQNTNADADNLWDRPTQPGTAEDYSANLEFPVGSEQLLSWRTTQTAYEISLYQQTPDSGGVQIQDSIFSTQNGSGEQKYTWTVSVLGANLTLSNIFFLWLDDSDSSEGFTCHYFNITAPVSSSSSTSIAKSTSSSTASATSSTLATTTSITSAILEPASTATDSPAPTSESTGTVTKVGLGVGLGIGIPIVLLLGFWLGLKAVKTRRAASRRSSGASGQQLNEISPPVDASKIKKPPAYADSPQYKTRQDYWTQSKDTPPELYAVHEAPSNREPAELG